MTEYSRKLLFLYFLFADNICLLVVYIFILFHFLLVLRINMMDFRFPVQFISILNDRKFILGKYFSTCFPLICCFWTTPTIRYYIKFRIQWYLRHFIVSFKMISYRDRKVLTIETFEEPVSYKLTLFWVVFPCVWTQLLDYCKLICCWWKGNVIMNGTCTLYPVQSPQKMKLTRSYYQKFGKRILVWVEINLGTSFWQISCQY